MAMVTRQIAETKLDLKAGQESGVRRPRASAPTERELAEIVANSLGESVIRLPVRCRTLYDITLGVVDADFAEERGLQFDLSAVADDDDARVR